MENIALQSLQIFYIIALRSKIAASFDSKMVAISTRNTKIFRTSQGYILHILQHFATKSWKFSTFRGFFSGISYFLLGFAEI